jgi:glycosyltransferase involved in cell wall biosynthesis
VNNINSSLNDVAAVSVVIPCFRCASTITRAIASIEQQTQKPAEVILVEDASGDDTLAVLQSLADAHAGWIKIIALPENQGVANARNIGWAAATQLYIAFLDADDAWHPQKIETQITYMKAHPEVALCGHAHRVAEHCTVLPDWQVQAGGVQSFPKWSWLLSNKFVTPSVMVRRDIYYNFAQNQRYMEDYRLWLELVYSGKIVTKLSAELVAIYKGPFGSGGLSAQLWSMEKGELNDYKHLYIKDYINLLQWLGLSLYSLLKFVRRLIIYWSWLRWKK